MTERPGGEPVARPSHADTGRRVGLPPEVLAPHAVHRWARTTPTAAALQHVSGGAVTYGQLDEECRRWAGILRSQGVAVGSIVATILPTGPIECAIWLGLGWLRAVEAPLNPALKGRLLAAALGGSGAALLITVAGQLDSVAEVVDALPELRRIVLVDEDVAPAGTVQILTEAGIDLVGCAGISYAPTPAGELDGPAYRDVATLLYTSGTTGPSKGVLVTWASVFQTWSWVPADALAAGEGLYCPFPMFHTSGKAALNATLGRGGRFVWRDRFSAADLWDDIRRTGCAAACLVGPMLAYVHSQPEGPADAENPLRSVLCGPMIPEVAQFEQRFGVRVATCYSMTEIGTPLATGWDHGPPGTCGRPRQDYPWTEVRVVNDLDEPLPPGQVGELVVRTSEPWALTAGYHQLPQSTAAAWRNGWFHSGDAFRYDEDGWYYLVDRMTDAIRRRGENISSFEVEQVVRDHPEVIDCAAVGTAAAHGEDEVLVAVEVVDRDRFDPAALRGWLEERLPRFMLPRFIRVVDVLPRNETSLRVQKFRVRADGVTPGTWEHQEKERTERRARQPS